MPAHDPANDSEVKVWDVDYLREAGDTCLARIYQPCGKGPFPALIYVHGGVWSQGSRTDGAFLNRQLAASGMTVVAIDFRPAPQHPYPTQVADFNFATRWLKAHAGEFNADPRLVGAMGASSGGHTVVLSAMRPHDPRYTAFPLLEAPAVDATVAWVIALWPVLDPYARYLYAGKNGRQELVAATDGYFLTEEAMQEGNPQLVLERGEAVERPPVLVIQGTADNNIPLSIPKRFARSYRLAGGELDLEFFPNMPHGFASRPGPETEHALDIIKKWIARRVATRPRRVG
ncbi:MAG: alpha/beta hydrolase [Chloroflexi bacterium]|nr:alpha/beta hydrolase [Chloroflexota bacterium]